MREVMEILIIRRLTERPVFRLFPSRDSIEAAEGDGQYETIDFEILVLSSLSKRAFDA